MKYYGNKIIERNVNKGEKKLKKAKLWKLGLAVTIVFAMLLSSVAGVVALDGITATWVGDPLDGNIDINFTGTIPSVTTFMIFEIPMNAFDDDVVYADGDLLVYVNQQGNLTTAHRASTAVIGRQNFGRQLDGTFNEARFIVRVAGEEVTVPEWAFLRISDDRDPAPTVTLPSVENRTWGVAGWDADLVAPTVPNGVSDAEAIFVNGVEVADSEDWIDVVVALLVAGDGAEVVVNVVWEVEWTVTDFELFRPGSNDDEALFTVTIPALTAPDVEDGYSDEAAALAGDAFDALNPPAFPVGDNLTTVFYVDGASTSVTTLPELEYGVDADVVVEAVTTVTRMVGGVPQTSTTTVWFVWTATDLPVATFERGAVVGDVVWPIVVSVPHNADEAAAIAALPSTISFTYTTDVAEIGDQVATYSIVWTPVDGVLGAWEGALTLTSFGTFTTVPGVWTVPTADIGATVNAAEVNFAIDPEFDADLGVVGELADNADLDDALDLLGRTVTITFTADGQSDVTATFNVDWVADNGLVGDWTGTIDVASANPAIPGGVVLPTLPTLTATINAEGGGIVFVLGDINGDGFVDGEDLDMMIDLVFYADLGIQRPILDERATLAADINVDGFIDGEDLDMLIDAVFYADLGISRPDWLPAL